MEATTTEKTDRVLSLKQSAEILGVSVRTLRRMHDRKEAPPRVRITGRMIGYRKSDIENFMASRMEA